MYKSPVQSWVGKIPWRRERLPTPVFVGFPDGWDGKESTCNGGNLGSIHGLQNSPGGGHGSSLQYSCLENPHGPRSLVGYIPWDGKESDMTEWLSIAQHITNSNWQSWCLCEILCFKIPFYPHNINSQKFDKYHFSKKVLIKKFKVYLLSHSNNIIVHVQFKIREYSTGTWKEAQHH